MFYIEIFVQYIIYSYQIFIEQHEKKLLFTLLVSLFITFISHAQLGIKAGFSATTLLENKFKNMPIGFNVGLTYDITKSVRAEVLAEGLYFSPFKGANFSLYPITTGAEYRFLKGVFRPYAGVNLGLMITRNNFLKQSVYTTHTSFTIHPKVGFDIKITEHLLMDLTLKYHISFRNEWGESDIDRITGANIGLIYVF